MGQIHGASLVLQVKQPLQCRDIHQLVFAIRVLLQMHNRRMQNLFHHSRGHVFHRLFLSFGQILKTAAQRLGDFFLPYELKLLYQCGDRRHLLE